MIAAPITAGQRRRSLGLLVRFGLAFFLLGLILSPLQYWLQLWSVRVAYDSARQLEMWPVAQEFAKIFERENTDIGELHRSLYSLLQVNPAVEVYLVREDGQVIYRSTDSKGERLERIRTEPIEHFLLPEASQSPPIYGDDPNDRKSQTIFSAARVRYRGQRAFSYAVLDGARYRHRTAISTDRYLLRYLATYGVLELLAAGGLCILMVLVLGRRVSRTIASVRAFRDGDLSSRIQMNKNDELGELAATFDEMADRISQSVKELENRDAMRRELIATISHDLRGPLANISAHLEQVQERHGTTGPLGESIDIVRRNTGQLGDLLAQLFELAKLEAKEIEPQLEWHLTEQLFEDLIISYQPKARQAGITLRYQIEPKGLMIWADLTIIGRVFGNLIENALRFTSDGGSIELTALKTDAGIRLSVRDTGIGIPESDIARVFEKFYQGQSGIRQSISSCGLGLSIVRRLVELHAASIQVHSERGSGTEFHFTLPTPEGS